MDLRLALSGLAGILMLSSVGRAESAPGVAIGGACLPPGTTLAEVLRILQAELAPSVVEPVDAAAPGTAAVTVSIDACTESPPGARVTVWNDGARTEGVVTLTGASDATRDRTFALAIAEAVRGTGSFGGTDSRVTTETSAVVVSGPVLLAPLALPPPIVPVDDSPDVAIAPPRDPRAVEWRLGLAGRLVVETTTPLVGLELGITADRGGVGLLGLWTERRTAIGDGTLTLGAVEGWYDVVRLSAVVRLRAAAELGVAHASGVPHALARGNSASAFHAGGRAGVAFLVPIGWAAFDGFLAGGGASSLTATVDGQDRLGLAGWFVNASAAMRFGGFP